MLETIIALWLSCAITTSLYLTYLMNNSQKEISKQVQENKIQIKEEFALSNEFLFLSFISIFFVAMISGPYAIYKLSFNNADIKERFYDLVLNAAKKDLT